MSFRLPKSTDFPTLTLSITPPPQSQVPTNILVLFHGLGDTHIPFTSLARQLQLPYTCIISLQAPTPVPSLFTGVEAPGFTWGDDIQFDSSTGELELDSCWTATGKVWTKLLSGAESCGFKARDVHLLGFGQGGMVALYLSAAHDVELGGVISIGARLPSTTSASSAKCKTPVLLLGGSRSRVVTKQAVQAIKNRFTDVEYIKWSKEGDGMPTSREEMLPLMKFWARRLGSRAGVPAGSVEVGR